MNELLSSGFRLYGKYFGVIFALVISIGLPCQMLSSYVAYEVYGRKNFIPALQTGALIELIFGVVLAGGILQALFVDRIGRRASYLECFSVGVTHWFQLCWTNFLMSCLIAMASILFFIPVGIWQLRLVFLLPALMLAIRFSLSITVVIAEGEWGLSALARSFRLTADKSWLVLGLCLFLYLPLQAAGFIGVGMLQTKPEFDTWQITAIFSTFLKLISCIIPVCFFCLYEKIIAEDRPEE